MSVKDAAKESRDDDIGSILDRIAMDFVKGSRVIEVESRGQCCKTIYGFKSIHSLKDFIDVVNNCKVVFVLVTTTYCPYCRMFKPVFAKVANEFRGSAAFIEANADYVPEIAMEFGVYSTPTTIVIIDGKAVDALLGYIPYQYFRGYVENILKSARCGEN
ncbi:thioredoxin family protein [Ignisphaera sp. 4213-co]|uniref:Thioredoxin family protein n=1 Tax=Ignisphaera cupida TaxID=3050454 RepID=A0ABD4Z6X9_9CREN|nr:thioredoxin family protein [Ignisphaera sp. 4213-co]MDK6028752.1 thioredoxin family protein [Ignisphaera sp. 4213-co]